MTQIWSGKGNAVSAVALALLCLLVIGHGLQAAAPAQSASPAVSKLALQIDPAQSSVHWILDTTLHTVHGTFSVKAGSLRIDPATGKVEGEVVVSAASGASGNDSRDKKMHKEILESAKFPEVTFRPDRVEGKILPEGNQDLQLHGKFLLHGSEHELTVPVHAERSGGQWSGSAKFKIPFIEWGLKDPSNFLLKVKKEVEVELDLKGKLGQ